MKNGNILSIYGSHDAAATFIDKTGKLTVLEYERFVKKRYAMLSKLFYITPHDNLGNPDPNHPEYVPVPAEWARPLGTPDKVRREFISYIKENIYDKDVKTIVYNCLAIDPYPYGDSFPYPLDLDVPLIREFFPNAKLIQAGHHTSHIAGSFFTSPFSDATIISIDGGGQEIGGADVTTMWATAKNGKLTKSKILPHDFGNAYGHIGFPISEINPGPDSEDQSLVYAGKVMGLCAYGKVRKEWIEPMYRFYAEPENRNVTGPSGCNLGVALFGQAFTLNCLKGQDSYDLAATSQYVFERRFFELFWDVIVKNDADVILTGGCALNVLLNQKLAERLKSINKKLYIPPDPNDCGLSLGQFTAYTKTKIDLDVYCGFPILDEHTFKKYKNKYNAAKCSVKKLVDVIKDGKIVGIIQGGSEIGPRALGNRSIICDPSIENMKDILNSKVKFREWYRPFAPVCRYEDMSKYFDNAFE